MGNKTPEEFTRCHAVDTRENGLGNRAWSEENSESKLRPCKPDWMIQNPTAPPPSIQSLSSLQNHRILSLLSRPFVFHVIHVLTARCSYSSRDILPAYDIVNSPQNDSLACNYMSRSGNSLSSIRSLFTSSRCVITINAKLKCLPSGSCQHEARSKASSAKLRT